MKKRSRSTKVKIGTKAEVKKLIEMVQEEVPHFCRLDDEAYEDSLRVLIFKLNKDGGAINLGYTTARPVGARSWITADGSKIIATLAGLLEGWADPYKVECLDCEPEYVLEQLWIPGTIGQEDYELGKMKGDWS
jgi:hypothetical protein